MRREEQVRNKPEVLTVVPTDNVAVVVLLGEHDMSTADQVTHTVAGLLETYASVVIDLSETEFIDCSIVHALEDGRNLARQRQRRLSLQLGTHPAIKRVLELTGLLASWPIYERRAKAIDASRRAHLPERLDVSAQSKRRKLPRMPISAGIQDASTVRREGATHVPPI